MPTRKGDDQYVTDSVSLAAFLVYRGHATDVQPTPDNRCTFRFPNSPELLADLNGFASGSARELRLYETARADLRRRMDTVKRRGQR